MSRIRARRPTARRRGAPQEDAASLWTPQAFVASVAALRPDPDAGCVLWLWSPDRHGYGRIMVDGIRRNATHYVLIAAGHPRPDPPANLALHSCDTPLCVHPGHLRWGSMSDNMEDRSAHGRHPTAQRTITPELVRLIRADHLASGSLDGVAEHYGINRTTVHRIVTRRTWRSVE